MKHLFTLLTALLLARVAALHAAELKLPSIFSDHMVLHSVGCTTDFLSVAYSDGLKVCRTVNAVTA